MEFSGTGDTDQRTTSLSVGGVDPFPHVSFLLCHRALSGWIRIDTEAVEDACHSPQK